MSDVDLWCCFCGKAKREVKNLIVAAPLPEHTRCGDHRHAICDECINQSCDLLLNAKLTQPH